MMTTVRRNEGIKLIRAQRYIWVIRVVQILRSDYVSYSTIYQKVSLQN